MVGSLEQLDTVPGYTVPVHRALTEHILLGGAPRSIAIVNGTLAAAIGIGLQLWLAGIGIWLIGHLAAVWAARRDPLFVEVGRQHLRIPGYLAV
ncbi:VirB3 family type IV secretion system protein [Aureimonas altamirensis]|uniref:VirB3 family type IV secretion system protein n=1 Tax=Aureimonas altamirensis TaxID=370622 RepID=UPI001E4343CA|nr:VirB3 family type IV secretion system protein [Aureimonas altamirensis]UHD46352.1 VirB3 family type IV secretion system protein [Aureimonas altamirensis]